MISHIHLQFGRAPALAPQSINVTPITIFVGPNNSGKSKVLEEIEIFCVSGHKHHNNVILEKLNFTALSATEAKQALEQVRATPLPSEALIDGRVIVGSRVGRMQVSSEDFLRHVQTPTSNLSAFCQWFLRHTLLKLDGRSRINLVNSQSAGDLQQPNHQSFPLLFRDGHKRQEVRRIVADAFGSYFVLDPTNLGQLRIRLSDRPPTYDLEECGIHDEAIRFHAAAQPIDTASDGVKAFTGIITEVVAGDPRVLLIDEPEAFLHPSLAFKLGYELSRAALKSEKRVFVSTHSPTFVMGCIQSGAPVTIIRLTFRGDVSTARVLPSKEILKLMRNPLLRSTGVLSGLFYEFVVVTESDADRAFYQEINERLLRFKPDWGIPNCLFLNAQNKQTVQTIMRPLRSLGIPTAAIVDIDVLKEGGQVWTNLLESANVPEISRGSFSTHRTAVINAMQATGLNMKRDGGIAILKDSSCQAAFDLLSQLAGYGVFVVSGGELESWLKPLGVTGHGPTWLVSVFEKMGEDPDSSEFLRPSDTDVWKFISDVRSWLFDPNRKGIPN